MEFIGKVGSIILQSRVQGSESSEAALTSPSYLELWRNGSAIQIAIFTIPSLTGGTSALLEQWTINYEPSNASRSIEDASTDNMDLKLIVQSLYGFVRRMPLTTAIKARQMYSSDIFHSISAAELRPCSFPRGVEFKTHRFNSAETYFGTVQLSVTFIVRLDDVLFQKRVQEIPVPVPEKVFSRLVPHASESGALIENTSFFQKPTPDVTPGSPRPSPAMVAKATSIAELCLGPSATSGTMRIPGRKSETLTSMRFRSTYDDLLDDDDDEMDQLHDLDLSNPYRPSPRPSPSSTWRYLSHSAPHSIHSHELYGSLVGSYEESILSGRMSASPSKPIEFTTEIGVFGKGRCKSSLKCPPHASIPCTAVYYQAQGHEAPSPYVSRIDLESGLKGKTPGLYRIPPKGMLQVILKNQNKTVVKVFLVNYDLSDMPEWTKTFIRQKSYSVDVPHGLRYAIHVKMVCHERKRIYLYHSIRVVFSHWMPSTSEKLKTVTSQSDSYVAVNKADFLDHLEKLDALELDES